MTAVQTCALPFFQEKKSKAELLQQGEGDIGGLYRSEERRVGKE